MTTRAEYEALALRVEREEPSRDAARAKALEEAADAVSPTNPVPCDCGEEIEGGWIVCRCSCSNRDDGERMAEWCADTNNARRIRALAGDTK